MNPVQNTGIATPAQQHLINALDIKNGFDVKDVRVEYIDNINLANVQFDPKTKHIALNDRVFESSSRFVQSAMSKYGIGKSTFSLFTPTEVFERVVERTKAGALKQPTSGLAAAVLHTPDNKNHLLGLVNAPENIINPVQYQQIIRSTGHTHRMSIDSNGVITSRHQMPLTPARTIGNSDAFLPIFEMNTPIDGYGKPAANLGLLRLLCANGAVGLDQMFRSVIKINAKHPMDEALTRFLTSFSSDDETLNAFSDKMEQFQLSQASLAEYGSLYEILRTGFGHSVRLNLINTGDANVVEAWYKQPQARWMGIIAGNFYQKYGITQISSVTDKKQQMLPVGCTVYDLVNIATERLSHGADVSPQEKSALGRWVSDKFKYDLDLANVRDAGVKFKHRDTFFGASDLVECDGIWMSRGNLYTADRAQDDIVAAAFVEAEFVDVID